MKQIVERKRHTRQHRIQIHSLQIVELRQPSSLDRFVAVIMSHPNARPCARHLPRVDIPKGTNAQNPSATQTTSHEEIHTHSVDTYLRELSQCQTRGKIRTHLTGNVASTMPDPFGIRRLLNR